MALVLIGKPGCFEISFGHFTRPFINQAKCTNLRVRYWQFNLPFKYPFTISKGTKTHQPTFVVELALGSFVGYGEAPAITYYNISVDQMAADLEKKKSFVEKFAFTSPE